MGRANLNPNPNPILTLQAKRDLAERERRLAEEQVANALEAEEALAKLGEWRDRMGEHLTYEQQMRFADKKRAIDNKTRQVAETNLNEAEKAVVIKKSKAQGLEHARRVVSGPQVGGDASSAEGPLS